MTIRRTSRLSGCLRASIGAIGIAFATLSWANIVITGTRVIYPGDDREVTVKLDNSGSVPSLVQAWIDNGDAKAERAKVNVPFVLLPPAFRVEPGKGQTLRIVYTHDPLPEDKESVFWLNVLDIPPNANVAEGTNLLRMAFRSRIKIFFRPHGLSADGATAAAEGIVWKVVPAPKEGGYALQASNPSRYHVNVSDIHIKTGTTENLLKDSAMLAPGESHTFDFDPPLTSVRPGTAFEYSTINDAGGSIKSKAVAVSP
jgi:chaperone protein EcpD